MRESATATLSSAPPIACTTSHAGVASGKVAAPPPGFGLKVKSASPKVTSAGWPRLVVASLRFIVLAECTNAWRMRARGVSVIESRRHRNLLWGRTSLVSVSLAPHVWMGLILGSGSLGRVLGPLQVRSASPMTRIRAASANAAASRVVRFLCQDCR